MVWLLHCAEAIPYFSKEPSMLRSACAAVLGMALTAIGVSPAFGQTTGDSADRPAGQSAGKPAGANKAENQTSQSDQRQDADGVQPLFFNVTVSAASRTAEETGKTPQAVTVATLDAIERRQARTPNQMLRE